MLRFGVIGLSQGNGHPYSWSAICNGYDVDHMENCGFPVIPRYLEEQDWSAAQLPGVRVTHVWTQDRRLSEQVAICSRIEHIVDRPEQMLGHIDALLLARDDAENHLNFARPYLEAGVPVYVDKPASLSVSSLLALYALERRPGQIFSCSALRYAAELQPNLGQQETIGSVRVIQATTPKDWDRYAIHIIDPVLNMIGFDSLVRKQYGAGLSTGGRVLGFSSGSKTNVQLTALGPSVQGKITLRVHGENGSLVLEFRDTFNAFRTTLRHFRDRVETEDKSSTLPFNLKAVEILEMGRA